MVASSLPCCEGWQLGEARVGGGSVRGDSPAG